MMKTIIQEVGVMLAVLRALDSTAVYRGVAR